MTLILGDCVAAMRELDDCSIDSVVTDPPYGISFMGKHWDRFDIDERVGKRDVSKLGVRLSGDLDHADARKPTARTASAFANAAGEAGGYDTSPNGNRAFAEWTEQWAREAFRLLKPGGHLLCFASTRTYHRMASGVEDAGFEIRDTLAWMFGSGFPKSLNLEGDWEGWGTALKPAFEPIVLARKPLGGTVAGNVAQHSTGALNIDATRIEISDPEAYARNQSGDRGHAGTRSIEERGATDLRPGGGSAAGARWPANVLLDEDAAALLDEQTGELTSGANPTRRGSDKFRGVYSDFAGQEECEPARGADSGGASRFFYCAKVSRAERGAGLDGFEERVAHDDVRMNGGGRLPQQTPNQHSPQRNFHPTVKPLALMRWLIRLVTPPLGIVLDPFLGSGSTGCAAALEGRDFVGIEREPDYMAIAEARIAFWETHGDDGLRICAERNSAERKRVEVAEAGQLDLLAGEAA